MPKRSSGKKLDAVQNARRLVDESLERAGVEIRTSETISITLVSQIMSQMGKKGGLIGGKRRMETMTPEQRKVSAQAAIKARWDKYRANKKD